MVLLNKILIALLLTAALAAGSYETFQASRLRRQVQTLRLRQTRLSDQIRQWQNEGADATNRLAVLLAENEQLNSKSTAAETQRLRTELARLKAAEGPEGNDPLAPAVDAWLYRVDQLKNYVAQHPDEAAPEFQFLTAREWLLAALPEESGAGGRAIMQELKSQAESCFALVVLAALQKYSQAHAGQFPADLSQLQPDCEARVEDILQQRYEIKPASVLPAEVVKNQNIKAAWVIAEKNGPGNRLAIYAGGYTYFY